MALIPDRENAALRMRAAITSLVAGIFIFAVKLAAWGLTGSSAILSDALESVVNVVAAVFAVFAVHYAAKPADRDHPYGHGKIEFLSAAFEGGLIVFAAITIGYAAIRALIYGVSLRQLDLGIGLTVVAAVGNTALGWWLLRAGKRSGSPALTADAHHILSDVWTTVGAVVGLIIVRLTHLSWLDPVVALLLCVLLARTGLLLVLEAAQGLLDQEEPQLLQRLVDAFNASHEPGVTGVHHLRAIRSGNVVHVDAHVFVPHQWTIGDAHSAAERLEREVRRKSGINGEIALHLDPCINERCAQCGAAENAGDAERAPITVEEAVGGPRRHRLTT